MLAVLFQALLPILFFLPDNSLRGTVRDPSDDAVVGVHVEVDADGICGFGTPLGRINLALETSHRALTFYEFRPGPSSARNPQSAFRRMLAGLRVQWERN